MKNALCPARSMGETKHVVVVDDELEIGRTIDAYLTEEGYRVSVATSGVQMREILTQQTVDLVILDLVLPDENGLQIARALRADSNIGIIMLTGRATVVDCIVGLEIGADDYMTKPADMRELLARVRSVLRRQVSEGAERNGRSNLVANPDLTEERTGHCGITIRDTGFASGRLTRREHDVLDWLLKGYSNKEIARNIGVKENTVAFHLRGVFKKLSVSNRTQAATMALRERQPDFIP